jgi:hypothetical protein
VVSSCFAIWPELARLLESFTAHSESISSEMTKYSTTIATLFLAFLTTPFALAQNSSPDSNTVKMTVTVEPRHGKEVPDVKQEDVTVMQGQARDKVTDWIPVQSGPGVDLFFLIDDGASTTALGSQLNEIRRFIQSQPDSVRVGVGYMRNGTVLLAQELTKDHAQAAKSLRLTLGDPGASGSPYFSLKDLVKRWPEDSGAAREVVMITDGIDRFWGGGGLDDPYVDEAIAAAQRADIQVYAIYTQAEGHFGHTFWRINFGQTFLSEVADQTGAEAYYLGNESPVTFTPYLDDIGNRLKHQFILRFVPQAEKKAGLQKIKLRTEVKNAELVAADRAYIPAGQ